MATTTSTTNKPHLTSRLPISYYYYLILFCSLFLSHPLCSSYFVLLLPHFLKFLSFLSPLFITTSLVLLLLLTFSPGLGFDKNSITTKSKLAFLEKLRPNAADEKEECVHQASEECEVYKILFEVPELKVKVKVQENGLKLDSKHAHELAPVDKFLICCGEDGVRDEIQIENSEEQLDAKTSTVEEDSGVGGQKNKTLEGLFIRKVVPPQEEEEEVKQREPHSQSKRVGEAKEGSDALCNREAVADNLKVRDDFGFPKTRQYGFTKLGGSVRLTSSSEHKIGYKEMGLDNYRYSALGGSMRREKEWKRTLACKLYEERNGGSGDDNDNKEGMDLLWEAYESGSTTTTTTNVEMQTKSMTEKSKSDNDSDDEEEEEEEKEEKLCCLRVLKFSSGKMGRRPNLVKISKALTFRGMGLGFLKHKHGTRTR